jgi:hypothetical protein
VEAARHSETSVNVYHNLQRHIPEDSNLLIEDVFGNEHEMRKILGSYGGGYVEYHILYLLLFSC